MYLNANASTALATYVVYVRRNATKLLGLFVAFTRKISHGKRQQSTVNIFNQLFPDISKVVVMVSAGRTGAELYFRNVT